MCPMIPDTTPHFDVSSWRHDSEQVGNLCLLLLCATSQPFLIQSAKIWQSRFREMPSFNSIAFPRFVRRFLLTRNNLPGVIGLCANRRWTKIARFDDQTSGRHRWLSSECLSRR
jgi:hypothetical protein